MEEDSVVGSQKVAERTHNRVSDQYFITYLFQKFFCSISFAVFVRMAEHFIAAAGAEGWCARFASSCPKNTRTLSYMTKALYFVVRGVTN